MNLRKNHRCPGCSGTGRAERINFVWVMRCTSCNGVFTTEPIGPDQVTRLLGHQYRWCRCHAPESEYYDLMVDDGMGIDRMHGWHHPGCGITQLG